MFLRAPPTSDERGLRVLKVSAGRTECEWLLCRISRASSHSCLVYDKFVVESSIRTHTRPTGRYATQNLALRKRGRVPGRPKKRKKREAVTEVKNELRTLSALTRQSRWSAPRRNKATKHADDASGSSSRHNGDGSSGHYCNRAARAHLGCQTRWSLCNYR